MTFKLPDDLSKVSPEDLDKLHTEALDAYGPLADLDEIDDEQLAELEALAAAVDSISNERGARQAAEAERAERTAAAKEKLQSAAQPADEPAAEAEAEAEPATETEVPTAEVAPEQTDEQPLDVEIPNDASELVDENEKEPVMASGKQSVVARAAGKIVDPEVPEAITPEKPKFSLIAAGDVRGFSAGQEMDFDQLGEAFARKIDGFQEGRGKTSRSDKYALAEMHLETPDELTIKTSDSPESASAKIKAAIFARHGANTPFGAEAEALVAAAGDWGAPSQILYDIPVIEQAPDGLLNLPAINVERGGFQHTLGIDFSVITGDSNFGFTQTEAQAAAKTVKPFISPTNPTFVDERLKVLGYGMEVGLLTVKGYPELIKRYTQGAATAFAHYRNKDTITRMLSYFPVDGSAIASSTVGSIVHDALDVLAFYAERTRYKYSLQNKQTFEIALPMWALDVFREDLAKRSGWDAINVPDSYIEGLFTQRKFNVNWLKDWTGQDLSTTATAWPATAQILMWLPGTFVKGGGPVVSYDAVVDYDHIKTNTIVQLFREESTLVAQMLNVAPLKFTIPVGTAIERQGRTGNTDLGITRA